VNAYAPLAACLLIAASACTAPTLAQRQENWRAYRKSVTFTCEVGMQADASMPEDVTGWCQRVTE
jgi:hypothetical protein